MKSDRNCTFSELQWINNQSLFRKEQRRILEMCVSLDNTVVSRNGYSTLGSTISYINGEAILISCSDLIQEDMINKLFAYTRVQDYREKLSYSQSVDIRSIEEVLKHYLEIITKYSSNVLEATAHYREVYSDKLVAHNDSCINHDVIDLAFKIRVKVQVNGEVSFDTFYDGGSVSRELLYGRDEEILKFVDDLLTLLGVPLIQKDIKEFYTIIMDQCMTGIFIHEVIGHLSEADSIHNFNDIHRGKKISSELVNIKDMVNVDARGYQLFDDEGTRCSEQRIIERGKLVGRMNTRKTAEMYGEVPKGNARSITALHRPICRMRHTSLSNGKTDIEDIIRGKDALIHMIGTIGGTSGFDFSVTAKHGMVIKDGHIIGRIKAPTIVGNVFEAMEGITHVCSDYKITNFYNGCGKNEQYPLPVSFSAPSICIQGGVRIGI